MSAADSSKGVILAACPLQKGVAAAITQAFYRRGWDICGYDQYIDHEKRHFFARVEWELDRVQMSADDLQSAFREEVADVFGMQWSFWPAGRSMRLAIFVTTEMAHLYDLLMRSIAGLWNAEVVLIVSNKEHLGAEAERFGVAFRYMPIDSSNKVAQEERELELLGEHRVDLVILARYMQIVTGRLIEPYRYRLINIHHSMLPAFPGARPYQQAHDRGVKLIGATSHYVTEDLDAGPIIWQDVAHVDHRKTVPQLVERGRDLETQVLARAVGLHVAQRVWVHEGRTIIFD